MAASEATSKTAVIAGAGPAGLTAALELLRRSDIIPLVFRSRHAGRRHLKNHQLPRQQHGFGRASVFFQVGLGNALVAGDSSPL